jgi:hypothetical protein
VARAARAKEIALADRGSSALITLGDISTLIAAASARGAAEESFQARVQPWMRECFGPQISADRSERNDRFIKEALELVQAGGYSADRAHALIDYVFGRPVGELHRKVGGVMVTLAALCLANGEDMHVAGETELTRILKPEIIAKIRATQASKAKGSALPITVPPGSDAS